MKKIPHEIHLRKDCLHLKNKHKLTFCAIADYLGLNETILRRFLKEKTGSLSMKNYKAMCNLEQLAKELKEAEEYKPEDKGDDSSNISL
jgi:methylphosphotriester-DNA--protein-cysteine methyltransferase